MKRLLQDQVEIFKKSRIGKVGLIIFGCFVLVAIFGPLIAPHGQLVKFKGPEGQLLRFSPPTWRHPLGTTWMGRDVLSQVILGTRYTLSVGLFSAIIGVFIGTNIGLISGYFGGYIDDIFMRLTDVAYGMPFLPFALVLIALTSGGGGTGAIIQLIIAITALNWRTTARVVRAEVLSFKEREFVSWARSKGGGHLRIMFKHIAPNLLPIVSLYTALSMVWAILAEASITFLGFGDPNSPSWGFMLYRVFTSGAISFAWWWFLPPAICIVLLATSGFFIGQAYEEVANPELKQL